jgi:transposase InsO family protein
MKAAASVGAKRRPGRPSALSTTPRSLIWMVARTWRELGRASGEGTLLAALDGRVKVRAVRALLKRLKADRARFLRRRRERERKSMSVLARNAVWALDATHLGRDRDGEVQGEVLKDCASTKILSVSVGRPSDAGDVITMLDCACKERGALPLVIVTDNGPAYRSKEVGQWCDTHGIAQLFTLPHTPEHNAIAERAHGEIKQETGLGKGCVLEPLLCARWMISDHVHRVCSKGIERSPSVEGRRESRPGQTPCEAHELVPRWCRQLARSVQRLNESRPRASRGYMTAAQLDAILPNGDDLVCRESFLRAVSRNVELAVRDAPNARAQRRARRESILCMLERYGLARRTRGGRPWPAAKVESQP